MLLILDGCDGAGKSTLALALHDALVAAYPGDVVDVRRCGVPPVNQHPLDRYERPLYSYRPGGRTHIIYDRHYLGEWVYPAVLGRPSVADEALLRHTEMFLASRGALLVHVRPPTGVTRESLAARGDDLVSVDQVDRITASFDSLTLRCRVPKMTYDRMTWGPTAVADIIAAARVYDGGAARLAPFVTYVGHPEPEYLLIGDVRHPLRVAEVREMLLSDPGTDGTRTYGPAFGPYPGTSGHFLLANLPPALVGTCGLANACDVDDVDALIGALGRPRVVALGARALRKIGRSRASGSVPHPQWARRFVYSRGVEYGEVIERAATKEEHMLAWRPAGSWCAR